jgi:hypothetical protein
MMRRTTPILALVAVVSVLGASDVRGAGGLVSPPKTTGPAVSFSVVTVIADQAAQSTKGQTALRVQKSGTFDGALFLSGYVAVFTQGCIKQGGFTLASSTDDRFKGFMDLWVPFDVRSQLFAKLGDPAKAAITDINDVACSTVDGVTSLSFTGTIQFATTLP